MGWGMSEEENEEHCKKLYGRIAEMQAAGIAIVNHKHLPKAEVRNLQLKADMLVYPTNFNETYCISLAECMAAGAIPIVSNRAALGERVVDGINGYLVGGFMHDAATKEAKQAFALRLVSALYVAESAKNRMREVARDTARSHDYSKIVPQWAMYWNSRIA
jgi:glycosyltransferase involved in cell wall biosynthesis